MFHFHAAVEDSDAHHGELVVCCVGVVVDAAEEGDGGVGPDGTFEEVGSAGVISHKGGNVVDKAVDDHQFPGLGFFLEVVPGDDGEQVTVDRPLNGTGFVGEFLELHRVDALADFILGERLQVGSHAEQGSRLDEPLCRVVSQAPVRVSVVHRELVVEIVVAFTDRDERGDDVVSRGMLVVERGFTEPVRERVYAKRRVVYEQESSGTGKEESTAPVAPAEAGDEGGEDESHDGEQGEVVFMLPSDHLVPRQVGHVGNSDLGSRLDEHPSDVGPPETMMCAVRVQISVGVPVVCPVTAGPPFDGALDGTGAGAGEDVLEDGGGVVRAVGPESVVACGDAETGDVVVDDAGRGSERE